MRKQRGNAAVQPATHHAQSAAIARLFLDLRARDGDEGVLAPPAGAAAHIDGELCQQAHHVRVVGLQLAANGIDFERLVRKADGLVLIQRQRLQVVGKPQGVHGAKHALGLVQILRDAGRQKCEGIHIVNGQRLIHLAAQKGCHGGHGAAQGQNRDAAAQQLAVQINRYLSLCAAGEDNAQGFLAHDLLGAGVAGQNLGRYLFRPQFGRQGGRIGAVKI